MRKMTRLVLGGVSAPLILTGSASAGFVGIKVVQKTDAQALGLFVCNVYAVFDRPEDQLIAVAGTPNNPLSIFVKQGKFFQHAQGAPLTAPFAKFMQDRTLAYDTFVTIGVKTDSLFDDTDDVSTTPGLTFANDSLSTSNGMWFITPDKPIGTPNANGQVLIFQGSFIKDDVTKGIAGQMLVQFTSNGVTGQSAYVSFDHQIPAPGALPLLGLAVLAGARRRRD